MYRYPAITFYITDDSVGFNTHLQSFYLRPVEPYYHKRLKTIRMLIRIGVIKDINGLCHYTQDKIGVYARYTRWEIHDN